MVTEQANMPGFFGATRLGYAKNGQTVVSLLNEGWREDGLDADSCPDQYAPLFGRDFRYDSHYGAP